MKTINLKLIISLYFIINIIACKSQNLPLNVGLSNISPNAHVKDFDNELNSYIGIYKGNFQGQETILYITKEEDKLVKRNGLNFYRDALVVKYIVKNSVGTVLQDTKNINSPNIDIISTKMQSQNSVILLYSGTNCGVGWGKIYLTKINSTQLSWEYIPNSTIIDSSKCPPGTDTTIYLPETKDLIFTKQ